MNASATTQGPRPHRQEAPARRQEVDCLPSRDLEAEAATVGAMLLEPVVTIPRVRAVLQPGDFYHEVHRLVFDTLLAMHDAGEPIDVVTLQARLRDRNLLDAVGGQAYLAQLLCAVPTAASAEHYARIVKDKARLRRVQALAHRALDESGDARSSAEVIEAFRAGLDELAEGEAVETFAAMRWGDFLAADLPAPLWVCEALAPGGGVTFLFSRPGLGKSLFAFELARCIARGEAFLGRFRTCSGPAVFFNLEMAAPQLQHRGRRFERHHPVGAASLYVVNEAIALNDPASFARFKALCEGIGPALVVIDPLIRALPGVDENAAAEVAAALAPAADLAREMGFALWLTHHSRKDQGRAGLDSLAGSRDLAARADVVLLMQALGGNADEGGLLRVTTVKNRWAEAAPPFCLRLENDGEGFPALLPGEPPNAKDEVLEVLAMKSPLETRAIVAELEGVKTRAQVNRALKDLLREGAIDRLGRGKYALKGAAPRG